MVLLFHVVLNWETVSRDSHGGIIVKTASNPLAQTKRGAFYMVEIFRPNPYFIQVSAINFLGDNQGKSPPPDLIFMPKPGEGNHYPIRVLLIGIPDGVNSTINDLYLRRFAQVYDWSPAIKAPYPGEIMRVTTKDFVVNS